MTLRYLSVCAGIEAATVAWQPLGFEPAAFSEIERFPRAVLSHRFPDVPLHGDFTTIKGDEYGSVDLLVGGTPCQSFSVAGLRGGLADPRGNLALEFFALAARARPRWIVWENVFGVLSADEGRAFGIFLGELGKCGYGYAYRVLDAQYFGTPQRRRRVFVVAYLGDWRPPAAVLFERESLHRHFTPSREEGEESTGAIAGGAATGIESADYFRMTDFGGYVADGTASTIKERDHKDATDLIAMNLRGREGGAMPELDDKVSLRASDGGSSSSYVIANQPMQEAYNISFNDVNGRRKDRPLGGLYISEATKAATLRAEGEDTTFVAGNLVRRLTPRERERLMGFEDDYTLVPYEGRMAADILRNKALGNSIHTGTLRWLGNRIKSTEEKINAKTL